MDTSERPGDAMRAVLSINRQTEQLAMAIDAIKGQCDPLLNLSALELLIFRSRQLLGRPLATKANLPARLEAGPLVIDLRSNDVTVAGRRIDLSRREHDLLCFLMRHPEEALSREQILLAVWGEAHRGKDNLLDVYIAYVRAKLRPHGAEGMIETLRGTGYILRAPQKRGEGTSETRQDYASSAYPPAETHSAAILCQGAIRCL